MLQSFASINTTNSPASKPVNHSLTQLEHYTVRVEGTKITLNIEYDPNIPLNVEERNFLLFVARMHMHDRLSLHRNQALLPKDDPYRIGGAPGDDVVLQIQSIKPFHPTYATASSAIMGLSRFFHESGKTGATRCLIADGTISGENGDRSVADILVWPAHI